MTDEQQAKWDEYFTQLSDFSRQDSELVKSMKLEPTTKGRAPLQKKLRQIDKQRKAIYDKMDDLLR